MNALLLSKVAEQTMETVDVSKTQNLDFVRTATVWPLGEIAVNSTSFAAFALVPFKSSYGPLHSVRLA